MDTDRILMCTLLLFHLKSSTCSASVSRPHFPPSTLDRQIEPLKQLAMIKAKILRHVKNTGVPAKAPVSAQVMDPPQKLLRQRDTANVVSFAEPPENFKDERIIQFTLSNTTSGGHVYVKHANILVRVRYKKAKRRQKRNRSKRDHQSRIISLNISTINSEGRPNTTITSVKATLKRAQWLRLTLPKEFVQNAIDSRNNVLQLYLQCHGCSKRADIILVNKKAKKARPNRRRKLRLHKRRPMLFMQTQVRRNKRQRRSVRNSIVQAIGARVFLSSLRDFTSVRSIGQCNKIPIRIDFSELGLDRVVVPLGFSTFYCVGTCIGHPQVQIPRANVTSGGIQDVSTQSYIDGADNERIRTHSTCKPVQTAPLNIIYIDHTYNIQYTTLPDILVTECGCTTDSVQ